MQVEYIGWLVMAFGAYRPLAPILAGALVKARTGRVVDLGSGNGGPIRDLARDRDLESVEFILTDLYPSPFDTRNGTVTWHREPVDALAGGTPDGFRTMFNAYHHFSEAEKRRLVEIHAPHGMLVAEVLRPGIICFFQVLIITTIGQILLCPFVRPFRWQRLFFTWIVPVNLFTVLWDGLVSVLRVDDRKKMDARAREFAPAGSVVESGCCGPWWSRVNWFTMIPERS